MFSLWRSFTFTKQQYNSAPTMKRYVLGDIHGAYKALRQCFERAGFDHENDLLICLGDVCDGWPETKKAIDELLKIKHLIFVLGNHDYWTLQWAVEGKTDPLWVSQGGAETIKSYPAGMPTPHISLLQNAPYYHLLNNRLFVHGGINPDLPLKKQGRDVFLWDRQLFSKAMDRRLKGSDIKLTTFDEVFIGHTPIHEYSLKPIKSCEIWFMDTGAGWSGVLSMMDIDTKEVFPSDKVVKIYPPGSGRV